MLPHRHDHGVRPLRPWSAPPAVLVVDDDLGTRETFAHELTRTGFRAESAASGAEAIEGLRSHDFDALIIDQQLPDTTGLDIVRAFEREKRARPFVLMSAYLTIELTVEAMRLGACDVIAKPVWLDQLVDAVHLLLEHGPFDRRIEAIRRRLVDRRARSAGERWAVHVLKGCLAEQDPKTLHDWATTASVSVSVLYESCRLAYANRLDSRDFMRVLRAVIHSDIHEAEVDTFLDVSDRRTLASLLQRGGAVAVPGSVRISVDEFLARQQFIHPDNAGLVALRAILAERE